ncbi:MFS general substrate transporter [Jackrogersella minutella]|nr:MFS general substrate transporter [Jackrogersella minutella]
MDSEFRIGVASLLGSLDIQLVDGDLELRDPRRRSRFFRDTVFSLPIIETDQNVGDNEIQLAKLNPLSGWHLWVTTACLCCGLFLSSMETTIIATSLVSISSSLGDSESSNWIVTAYLVTYTGFLIIFARISDLFGRKPTLSTALILFLIFSLACGSAKTMTQLIIFRAFQGVGGAGLYAMAMSIIVEVTPFKYIGVASGLMGSIFAMSSLLGPILGGAITSGGSWRWIFYINGPPCFIALVLVLVYFPANSTPLPIRRRTFSYVDYPGVILSLAGIIVFLFAIEQGGTAYAWNSPTIIVSFAISSVALTGFMAWEWLLSRAKGPRFRMLPLFPIHLVTTRILGFIVLTAFITGFPFMITTVFLPQRFQLQNGLLAVDAGIRMLPLLLLSATGAGLGGVIASRKNISWYLMAGSLCLQIIALGLMTTLPTTGDVHPAQYGYQVLLGLGFGFTLSSLVILARVEVKGKDSGIAIGAITQVRVLGGLIGIAMAQAVLSSRVVDGLSSILTPEKLSLILQSAQSISGLTDEERMATKQIYGEAFNLQNRIMVGISAVSLLSCLGAWRRRPVQFVEIEGKDSSTR